MDCSNDDDNDFPVEDMSFGEGLRVEEVFGDEYIEYDVMRVSSYYYTNLQARL